MALEDNSKWPMALRQVGGDDLGSNLLIPPYFFLLNGWRVRPMEANHLLIITGNLFVDGGGQPIINTIGNYNVSVQYSVPVQAQAFYTSDNNSSGNNAGGASSSSGLTLEEHNKLIEISKILTNSKEIINNKLVIYDTDGVTPLIAWSLTDKAGRPSETSVFKSEKI
jgi:hypothetical protein